MECPTCDGEMYDNRETKRNPKAPDYVCKDKLCRNEKGFVTSVWEKPVNYPHRQAVGLVNVYTF